MKKYEELEKLVSKENIKYNESMKKYTTMKVGGNVECLVTPTSIKEITQVVKFARENNIKLYVLGNGSNVIVKDEGILGIVLKLSNKFADVRWRIYNCFVWSNNALCVNACKEKYVVWLRVCLWNSRNYWWRS